MRINIAVHGRFYAFDLAKAYLELGHDVTLLTNYPRSVVAKFGFPEAHTRSLLWHGIASRVLNRTVGERAESVESVLKTQFGAWVARNSLQGVDVLRCWSGVAEEAFSTTRATRVLTRSSAHIRAQDELLRREGERADAKLPRPSKWIIAREQREYALADLIVVPSEFARRSFDGEPYADRVVTVPLAVALERWRPAAEVVEQRRQRIRDGRKLRVLYAGLVTYRKGMHDLGVAMRTLGASFEWRFVGQVQQDCARWAKQFSDIAQFEGHVREDALKAAYAWADLLVFPSVEDGFGVVLAQAQASAVPFIASTNTGAADLLHEGGRGWIVPAQSADAIIEQLRWCSANREALADAVAQLYNREVTRTWSDVARDELQAITRLG